eukprot:Clim_evm22s224 gene=Clim_evmTU22s224
MPIATFIEKVVEAVSGSGRKRRRISPGSTDRGSGSHFVDDEDYGRSPPRKKNRSASNYLFESMYVKGEGADIEVEMIVYRPEDNFVGCKVDHNPQIDQDRVVVRIRKHLHRHIIRQSKTIAGFLSDKSSGHTLTMGITGYLSAFGMFTDAVCERALISLYKDVVITKDNVLSLFALSIGFWHEELLKQCLEFLCDNLDHALFPDANRLVHQMPTYMPRYGALRDRFLKVSSHWFALHNVWNEVPRAPGHMWCSPDIIRPGSGVFECHPRPAMAVTSDLDFLVDLVHRMECEVMMSECVPACDSECFSKNRLYFHETYQVSPAHVSRIWCQEHRRLNWNSDLKKANRRLVDSWVDYICEHVRWTQVLRGAHSEYLHTSNYGTGQSRDDSETVHALNFARLKCMKSEQVLHALAKLAISTLARRHSSAVTALRPALEAGELGSNDTVFDHGRMECICPRSDLQSEHAMRFSWFGYTGDSGSGSGTDMLIDGLDHDLELRLTYPGNNRCDLGIFSSGHPSICDRSRYRFNATQILMRVRVFILKRCRPDGEAPYFEVAHPDGTLRWYDASPTEGTQDDPYERDCANIETSSCMSVTGYWTLNNPNDPEEIFNEYMRFELEPDTPVLITFEYVPHATIKGVGRPISDRESEHCGYLEVKPGDDLETDDAARGAATMPKSHMNDSI